MSATEMQSSLTDQAGIDGSSPLTAAWTVHQLKSNPVKGIIVFMIILIIAFWVWVTTLDIFLFLLAAAILIGSVLPYYLPVTYTLNEEEILIKTGWMIRTRPWNAFRRWEKAGLTFKLYTVARPSRMDNYRAWLIRANRAMEQPVMTILERKIGG